MERLADLIARTAQDGVVTWIGLRPARHAPVVCVEAAYLDHDGLQGDHRVRPGKRALSLIQAEHLPVIQSLSARDDAGFGDLRRNIAVSGLNLLGLKSRHLQIGAAEIRITSICAPCSRMEAALGQGGYAALRGHGGMTAEVIEPGQIAVGDVVSALTAP